MEELLKNAATRAARYLKAQETGQVYPDPEALEKLDWFAQPLQENPIIPEQVLAELDEHGSPGTVASAGGRYFGFVIGGSLPAALAANFLAGAWDQNAGLEVASPVGAVLEQVCRDWLLELFGLGAGWEVGFTSGATLANFTGLAAARHALLSDQGWEVETQGLFGAPPITVIVGGEVHASLLKALSLLGLGRERVVRVPVDEQGCMLADRMPEINGPTIVCLQAGNVNTGAFDPLGSICQRARAAGAWVHIDGAFGLWAAVSPATAGLAAGIELADSIATDAHKWLNVPYDSGLVFVREPLHLRAAMAANAAYLITSDHRDAYFYVPEMSRRARAIEIWAALRSLGRSGLADIVERTCSHARRFAKGLETAGYQVLNEVVLNQVLVSFGSPEQTRQVISSVQQDGTCWCGGTEWQGHTAMRISVSSWRTTEADVEQSLAAIIRVAQRESAVTP